MFVKYIYQFYWDFVFILQQLKSNFFIEKLLGLLITYICSNYLWDLIMNSHINPKSYSYPTDIYQPNLIICKIIISGCLILLAHKIYSYIKTFLSI
jgi:hypothetical protein